MKKELYEMDMYIDDAVTVFLPQAKMKLHILCIICYHLCSFVSMPKSVGSFLVKV